MGSYTMTDNSKPTILSLILAAGPKGINTDAIVDRLYGDREDGGPVTAENVVAVMVHKLRKAGHPIETVKVYRYGALKLKPQC